MDHQIVAAAVLFKHCQPLLPQPAQHRLALGRLQHVMNRVATMRFAHAVGDSQQMQVMVAEQALRRIAQRHQAAKGAGRVRPAVDQVTQHIQRVAAGRERNFRKQALQCAVATL